MRALRRILATMLVVVSLAFPVQAFAWPGEGLWDDATDAVGDVLDAGHDAVGEVLDTAGGILEVGWEGIYGAGCGVKNLATWDGTSCETSVADSGDKFRTLIRDIDDCMAEFEPTGIAGFGTDETVGTEPIEYGIQPEEVEGIIDAALSDQATIGSEAMSAYLKSPAGRKAVAKNPLWQKVMKRVPVLKYVGIVVGLSESCGASIDFLMNGPTFLLTGQETWRQGEGGVWLHCTTHCQYDQELNYPGCDPWFTGYGDSLELVCYPGTGDPGPPKTASQQLRSTVCGAVASSSDSDFNYEEYCDERISDATAACRAGTSRFSADVCSQLGVSGPTQVQTVVPGAANGTTSANGLDPRSVPGGSVEGTCAGLIRLIAQSPAGSIASSQQLTDCLGTSDTTCYRVRAQAAAGYSVFPMQADLQKRCFG